MGGYFSNMVILPPTDSLAALIRSPNHLKGGSDLSKPVAGLLLEKQLSKMGYHQIAGIDEAGRGPLAGPVVAAGVILSRDNVPAGLNDSKQLDASRRSQLFDEILATSQVSIATASALTIDKINVRQATLLCMQNANIALSAPPDWSLIDGRDIPEILKGKASAVIGGDGYSQSIAAASIIAKVFRDRLMTQAAQIWPLYGFEKHKGYGTKIHREAIANYGPCPLHRMTFAPLSQMSAKTC